VTYTVRTDHFAGGTEIWHFGANGNGSRTDRGTHQLGPSHSIVINGGVTFRYRVAGDRIHASRGNGSASERIHAGAISTTIRVPFDHTWNARFSCSGNSLTLTALTAPGGHLVLARQ
jgi:hypothetical protein